MAFTIKVRTLPGSPMMAEYECPKHGRFELLVERDDKGDPPASTRCPGAHSVLGAGGDAIGPNAARRKKMGKACGELAELALSAPKIKFWSRDPVAAEKASKSDEWDPRMLDTRPLAEGKMTKAEWRKWQRGISQERRYQKKLKAGKISKRIQVGGG